MRDGEIVKNIIRRQGRSITSVSEEMGYTNVSGLRNRLNLSKSQGMTTEMLTKVLGVLNCDLIIRDSEGNEWKID